MLFSVAFPAIITKWIFDDRKKKKKKEQTVEKSVMKDVLLLILWGKLNEMKKVGI